MMGRHADGVEGEEYGREGREEGWGGTEQAGGKMASPGGVGGTGQCGREEGGG